MKQFSIAALIANEQKGKRSRKTNEPKSALCSRGCNKRKGEVWTSRQKLFLYAQNMMIHEEKEWVVWRTNRYKRKWWKVTQLAIRIVDFILHVTGSYWSSLSMVIMISDFLIYKYYPGTPGRRLVGDRATKHEEEGEKRSGWTNNLMASEGTGGLPGRLGFSAALLIDPAAFTERGSQEQDRSRVEFYWDTSCSVHRTCGYSCLKVTEKLRSGPQK